MSSDTNTTHNNTAAVVEERRVYHYRILPSKAAELAEYADRTGMKMYRAVERAIDLLVQQEESECATR